MRNNYLTMGALCLVSAMSIAALIIASSAKPQSFGVVDTRLIIAEEAKRIAKQDPAAHTSIMKMRAIADKIEEQINHWGKDHKLTLLQKQSVLSGNLPDYTKNILHSLSLELNEEKKNK